MAQSVTQTKIRDVPIVQDPGLRNFLSDMKRAVEEIQPTSVPPQAPTGLKVTPIAGGNVVQFTRSNATNFRLYHSTTSDRGAAVIVDLGSNNSYTDSVGDGGIQKWYWVEAVNSQSVSAIVGPSTGTTLALGTPATVTPVSAPSYQTVYDTTLNRNRPVVYAVDRINAPKQAEE